MRKTFMMTLILLSSTSALADLKDCSKLFGQFTGSYQGKSIPIELKKISANTVKISLADEGGSFVVDGTSHKSDTDDTTYVAACSSESGIEIKSSFKNKVVSVVNVHAISNGIQYLLQQNNQTLVINAAKN